MGDDCWSDDGREADSTYRTISSLRELVGPGRYLVQGQSEEQSQVSLKGTRFRRVRCSEDPGYFVSTPLERFKITKQSKLEAKRRLQDKDGSAQEALDSDWSSKFEAKRHLQDKDGSAQEDLDSDWSGDFDSRSSMCSKGVNNNFDFSPGANDSDSTKLTMIDKDAPSRSDIHSETPSGADNRGAKHSGTSPIDIIKVRDNARTDPIDRPSRKSGIVSDNPTKYPSPDRFKVTKTSESVVERSNNCTDRFTVSNTDREKICNESNGFVDSDLKESDLDRNSFRNRPLDYRRASMDDSIIKNPLLFKTEDQIKFNDRFKVTNSVQRSLDLPFLKDFSNFDVPSSPFRDLSPSFRDLSCGTPRRRLSQCPEEDETEEEPTKRPILPRLHMDKLFFDSSLVEMKSQASSSSTIDTIGSIEEVWVKRIDPKPKQDVGGSGDASSTDGGSTMSSTTSRGSNSDSSHSYRSESTWGGGNPGRQMVALVTGRRHRSGGRHSVYHTVTGAVGGTGPPRVQQTHIPSIFEVFRPRSKSDANANQKKPSLMGHVRNAMGGSGGKSGSVGDEAVPSSSGSGSRGPVAKVIHLFRNRSQSAASADEKRKARAAALQQQQQQYAASVIRRNSLDKRRLSLGTVGGSGHRGSDPTLDPNHAAILFRDSRGLPVADPFLEKVNLSDLEEDESQIFVKFFRFHKCYDLIPTSAKLVVFDTQLLVKKAFFALVYNGVRAAPLWDSNQHKFVGMLTITDFIKILKMYYGKTNGPEWMQEMEAHKLDTWRKVLKDEARELVAIGPDASLYEAISILVQHRIHRLPVVDPETNNVLYILTHKRILRFLFLYIKDLPRPSFMSKTLSELRVGTFEDVATAKSETTIISALDVFMDRRVSALPIVDEDNKLVDIYAKFDVINLAAEKTYDNLDVSLKEANEHRNEWFEGVHKCSMDDTLYTIIERIVRAEVHRLVVTDDEDRVIGIISLSDILEYLVLRPAREDLTCRSESPSVSESLAYSNTQEDTIAEGEEDEERERSPSQTWSQPQWSVTPASPLTSA